MQACYAMARMLQFFRFFPFHFITWKNIRPNKMGVTAIAN